MSLLLLDDEPAFRDIFERYLGARGFTVLTAGKGVEALALFQAHSDDIALLVVDLILPNEDSRAVASYIKSLRPGLPVLYVSASSHQQVLSSGLLNAEDDFLKKPFSLNTLEETIRTLLDSATQR